ncbi:hypothetical protein ACWCSD_46390 [Nonomuraea sp. NPDC001684]
MTELDRDGRRLFLELSADLYEQAIRRLPPIPGDQPRKEGLAFWEAVREAMDAEVAEHKRRMTIFRMLEDLAVYRMARVENMTYDRIGARAGGKSRSWAFQHTMPQDLVDGLVAMYAQAEQDERDAFINAGDDEPPAVPDKAVSVIPLASHAARRPASDAARRSILYRQLRRFLGGAAAVAGPAYLAAKAAAESYTATVQTALMSNGALTPMPGLDPLSGGGLSGMLSASAAPGATAQAAGPVSTVVGKVVAGAVISVQATAGFSAPAAVALTAAAGTPVVMAVEDAAKPIAVALGLQPPVAEPTPDLLVALPDTPGPVEEEVRPDPAWQVPTVYGTETPSATPTSTSPSLSPSAPLDRTATRAAAPAPTTVTSAATAPSSSPSSLPKTASASAAPTTAQPSTPPPPAEPTATAEVTTMPTSAPAPMTTPTPPAATPTPSTSPPPVTSTPDPTPTATPPTYPDPTPTSSAPVPTSTPTSTPPEPMPSQTPTSSEPKPTKPAEPEPEPTSVPSTPPTMPENGNGGGSDAPSVGSAPNAGEAPVALPAGAGAMLPRPAAGWWYGPAAR